MVIFTENKVGRVILPFLGNYAEECLPQSKRTSLMLDGRNKMYFKQLLMVKLFTYGSAAVCAITQV